ncbi:MAG: hypothetical protein AB9846_14895 [Tenuifilaceae bacterium]
MILTIPFKDLLPAIIFFLCLFIYVIYDWKNVYFKLFANPKGKIYNSLHKYIQEAKNRKDYNPNIILNKYFSEAQLIPQNENATIWTEDKFFWYRIYLNYPLEFLSKLENNIELKDIQYFENILYNQHPKSVETEVELKNILVLIKNQTSIWAKTPKKREQAVRLGYFVIKSGLIKPENNLQESWLKAWNDELKDSIEKPLTAIDLIKNPWSTGAGRTEKSIVGNIQEIHLFFYKINWRKGIELIENGVEK